MIKTIVITLIVAFLYTMIQGRIRTKRLRNKLAKTFKAKIEAGNIWLFRNEERVVFISSLGVIEFLSINGFSPEELTVIAGIAKNTELFIKLLKH